MGKFKEIPRLPLFRSSSKIDRGGPERGSSAKGTNSSSDPIPVVPGKLPVLGHLPSLIRDPFGFLRSLPQQGRLVEVGIGPARAVVVCDHALTREVLARDEIFDKGGFIFDRAREALGNGLATCPHRDHRRQRRLAQPALHRSRLPGYARLMTPEIMAVTRSWRDGEVIDLLNEMSTIAGKITIATMFIGAPSPVEIDSMLGDVTVLLAGFYKRALMPPPVDRLPFFGNRRYDQARNRLRHTISRLIADHRAKEHDNGDLLSMLLASGDDGDETTVSEGEMIDQILTLFIASFETTTNSLVSLLHLVAHHPDVQRRLHAEVDSVLAGASVDFEHLPCLTWTSQIVTEALRLYPPGWLITRRVAADTRLGGHHLSAGTPVIFSPYLLHHRPDIYDGPEEFRPDRWNGGKKPERDQFIPFGYGARSCIGATFATIEITLILAAIAADWRLHPMTVRDIAPIRSTMLRPRNARVRVTAREPASGASSREGI
jgi:cytochrome P450